MTSSLQDRTILLAGGTSTVGRVVAREALARGAQVVVVGHDEGKLAAIAGELEGVRTAAADLTDEGSVGALADRLHGEGGRIDGLLHLVGGWRGGSPAPNRPACAQPDD